MMIAIKDPKTGRIVELLTVAEFLKREAGNV